jgi:hypothetical protein
MLNATALMEANAVQDRQRRLQALRMVHIQRHVPHARSDLGGAFDEDRARLGRLTLAILDARRPAALGWVRRAASSAPNTGALCRYATTFRSRARRARH